MSVNIRVDRRLSDAPAMVAESVCSDIGRLALRDLTGSVYLGLGSADLIAPNDPLPHVMAPLTRGRRLDAIERHQLAHAAAVVAMDEAEAAMLATYLPSRSAVVLAARAAETSDREVIRTGNPFDAAEVEAFLRACPNHAEVLHRHRVALRPFSPRSITLAVVEALMIAGYTGAATETPNRA
jgi:hypothetical protein